MTVSHTANSVLPDDPTQFCTVRILGSERHPPSGIAVPLAYRMVVVGLGSALRAGQRQTVVVTDAVGKLIVVGATPGAAADTQRFAASKAFTACALGVETRQFSDSSAPTALGEDLSYAQIIAGGVPVREGSTVIGAVGVAGGDATADESCAHAACAVFERPQPKLVARLTSRSAEDASAATVFTLAGGGRDRVIAPEVGR